MNSKDQSTVNRRTVLKAAGVSTVLPTIGSTVSAKASPKITFSEVGLVHEVPEPLDENVHYPYSHVDEFSLARTVDEIDRTLYLNRRYIPQAVKLAKNNRALLAGEEYSVPQVTLPQNQAGALVTKRGAQYRILQALRVESGYTLPQIVITEERNEIAITTPDGRTLVPTNEEVEVEFTSQEVTIQSYTLLEKDSVETTGDDGEEWEPWRKPKPKHFETETIEVVPRLKVRNYGQLEVADVDSPIPRPHRGKP